MKMFNESLIDLTCHVTDEVQLFDLIGQKAIDLGFANPDYIAALKSREKSYPTGLKFPQINLALPHVDGVHINKPFIFIVRNDSPIQVKQMGDGQLMTTQDFLFLGLKDGRQQPKLLAQLIAVFQDKTFTQKYLAMNSVSEMYNLMVENLVDETEKAS